MLLIADFWGREGSASCQKLQPNLTGKPVVFQLAKPDSCNKATLTMDNGNEFAQHKRVAKFLLAKVYFAHPYCAWERRTNENTNRLLRQYFPKGTNVKTITQTNIRRAENRLNDRPRKALEIRSPNDVFQHGKS
jgi:IS30 family transposase